MRVILLTSGQSWSGVEVHTVCLAGAIKAAGHDVVIVELGRRLYQRAPRLVPCSVLSLELGRDLPAGESVDSIPFRMWWKVLGGLQADVAIAVKGTYGFGGHAMDVACRVRFPRYIVIEHMHEPLGPRWSGPRLSWSLAGRGLWWYRKKIAGFLRSVFPHKVVCVSQAVASTLREDYCYSPSKLVAVYTGVDTAVFCPNQQLRQQARDAFGIPEKAMVFGTIGRLSPMKNHGQLIAAFSRVCRHWPRRDFWLVIVGDGPLRPDLVATARSEGVAERVVFPGFTATPETIYPAFDVFCLPSSGEALGISLLEAMACGCPTIAAAVGGVPEVLGDKRVGWLVPAGDEAALVAAMSTASGLSHAELVQMGHNGRERIVAQFNANDRWGELVSVVEGLLGRSLISRFFLCVGTLAGELLYPVHLLL